VGLICFRRKMSGANLVLFLSETELGSQKCARPNWVFILLFLLVNRNFSPKNCKGSPQICEIGI
jgi:hypothetical protein